MRPDLSELVAALSLTALVTTGCPAQSKSPAAPAQAPASAPAGGQGNAVCAGGPGKTSAPAANSSCSGDSGCAAAPDTKTMDAQAIGAKTGAPRGESAPAAPASQPAKSGTSACAGDSGCASGDSKCASDTKTTKPE